MRAQDIKEEIFNSIRNGSCEFCISKCTDKCKIKFEQICYDRFAKQAIEVYNRLDTLGVIKKAKEFQVTCRVKSMQNYYSLGVFAINKEEAGNLVIEEIIRREKTSKEQIEVFSCVEVMEQ